MKNFLLLIFSSLLFLSCSSDNKDEYNEELESKMNALTVRYIKLVLRIGKFDPDYVDSYYGPDELQKEVDEENIEKDSLAYVKLSDQADQLLNELEDLHRLKANNLEVLRYRFLYKQLLAVKAKIFMLRGGVLTFEEEVKALYDAEPQVKTVEEFQAIIDELDELLPGEGTIQDRISKFRLSFIIPKDKVDAVFRAAINECRSRTLKQIDLPEGENFKLEYVENKAWGGYNWYKGNAFSLIQVNTDLPIYIDRAVDLAAHEGYPGHHVYNALLEQKLVKENKWMEFTIYPLFSPQSLIAEGTANFGIDVVFPADEREDFEMKVLFPLAGLDPSQADKYYRVQELTAKLDYVANEAARNYLNGKFSRKEAVNFLVKYGLSTPEKAERNVKFIEKYRSYIINYSLGLDIVKNYVIKKGGTDDNSSMRWKIFEYLLSSPQTPSGLK